MKRSELFFAALLVPIDFAALLLAGSLAYHLRTSPYVQSVRPAVFVLDFPYLDYLRFLSILSILILLIFALQGLYTMKATRRLFDEFTRIFAGISIGFMAIIIYIFLTAELFQSRFILLAAYALAILFVSMGRWLVRKIQSSLLKRGIGIHRVLLVGNGRFAEQLSQLFARKPRLGYRVVGTVDVVDVAVLEDIYRSFGIDEVIKADQSLPAEDNLILLDFCDTYKISYRYIPDLFETYASHITFTQIQGVPMMELQRTPLDGWGRIAKRVMDVVGAGLGLIVLAPLFLVTAILLKLDSPGPVFYHQTRVGRNKQSFEMYKFRSMRAEYCVGNAFGGNEAATFEKELRQQANERSGPLFKMRDDPRVTRVGKALRKTRIDELPQLFNVLRGEMSLIGPRPHLPEEVERYSKHHHKLFTIKPGMSGMAQVNGNAGLPFEQEAKLDIGYIEDWSLWLDVLLLLKTFKILFADHNAV